MWTPGSPVVGHSFRSEGHEEGDPHHAAIRSRISCFRHSATRVSLRKVLGQDEDIGAYLGQIHHKGADTEASSAAAPNSGNQV